MGGRNSIIDKLRMFKKNVSKDDYWSLRYPVDFLCYSPDEFEKQRKKITIVKQVVDEGIEI
ncbi:MAG: hypothetical protein HY513_02100 [Candidatus Aenigmarchaeota archaeon]|nr:hypothetical protein [Candidatus Aenigmarchaeota archaeon]